MKWLTCGPLLVLVVLLSFGRLIQPSHTPRPACNQPDILFSYLDIDHYNRSYPYVDSQSVLDPVVDFMLQRGSGPFDSTHDLFVSWLQVCRAEDPGKEIAAWENLAREITHRLHTDESVFKVSKILFGDRMGAWIMKPHPKACFMGELDDLEDCVYQLSSLYRRHCGPLNSYGFKYIMTFSAMCGLGVKDDEFADAVRQTCWDYVYIPNPLRDG